MRFPFFVLVVVCFGFTGPSSRQMSPKHRRLMMMKIFEVLRTVPRAFGVVTASGILSRGAENSISFVTRFAVP